MKRSELIQIITKEFLLKEHFQNGLTVQKMSKDIGVDNKSIKKLFDEYGMVPLTSQQHADLKIINKKFGRLIVECASEEQNTKFYLYKCYDEFDINKKYPIYKTLQALKRQRFNHESDFKRSKYRSTYKDIDGITWSQYKADAKRGGMQFDITPEYVWELFENQNKKCSLSNLDLNFIRIERNCAIDRIDSNKGYIEGNVWVLHKDVNQMKWDLILSDFVKNTVLVAENYNKDYFNNTILASKCSSSKVYKGYKNISMTMWTYIKNNALRRKIDINITIEESWALYEKQNGLCSLTKQIINFPDRSCNTWLPSLDRINSNLPYSVENCHWIHKDINLMKYTYNLEYFINLCKLIATHGAKYV